MTRTTFELQLVDTPESPIHKAAMLMKLPFQQDTDSALRMLNLR